MISEATQPIDPPPSPGPSPGPTPGPGIVIEPTPRYTQRLQIAELFKSATLMTTEADVDALTSDLSNKLKGYIRANKNVRLV